MAKVFENLPDTKLWRGFVALLWSVSALGKVLGLISFPHSMTVPNDILQIPTYMIVGFGLIWDLLGIVACARVSQRDCGKFTMFLTVPLMVYHLATELLQSGKCHCLGALVDIAPFLSDYESSISIATLFMLFISGWIMYDPMLCSEVIKKDEDILTYDPKASAVIVLPILLFFSFIILFYRDANLGSDEGLELAKAGLLGRHPSDWANAWNDQPVFYTKSISAVTQIFGTSYTPGRVISLVCTFALLYLITKFGEWKEGYLLSFAVGALLIQYNSTSVAMVSMIPELPAYSVGLLAALPLFKRLSIVRVVFSAFIAALAMHIKFTALFSLALCPVFLITHLFKLRLESRNAEVESTPFFFKWGLLTLCWIFVAVVVFHIGILASEPWSWDQMILAHLGFVSDSIPESLRQYRFSMSRINDDTLLFVLSILGILIGFLRGRRSMTIAWIVLIVTAICLHSKSVVYWWYYGIHFAFPMTMLSLNVLIEIAGLFRILRRKVLVYHRNIVLLWVIFATSSGGLFLHHCIMNVSKTVSLLERSDSARITRIRKALKPFSFSGLFGFSTEPGLLAYSEIDFPPELLIVSHKRFWSNQISTNDLVRIVKEKSPTVLLLPGNYLSELPQWRSWLSTNYSEYYRVDNTVLYHRSDFAIQTNRVERVFPSGI